MGFDGDVSRKEFLQVLIALGASASVRSVTAQEPPTSNALTVEDLAAADRISGFDLGDAREGILTTVRGFRAGFEAIRGTEIPYTIEPPVLFRPWGWQRPLRSGIRARYSRAEVGRVPDDLAFRSARELAALVRARRVSPVDLTELYLERCERYDGRLRCVVTLMRDQALAEARQAHDEIRRGRYRGPLHGLPYALKDLFATRGVPTTWGAAPFEHQVFDYDAEVVKRLREAGAILLGKFSLGALAMGDVWFRGRTNNPWNLNQGSSGSSAGSACATAAGLCAFSIGTETLGSIMSPSHQCRVTGLRPTFGRVSRAGGMALSWTMDKVGPICREVEDCAMVFAAILGADQSDLTTVDAPFEFQPDLDLSRLKIRYLPDTPTAVPEILPLLIRLGARPEPIEFSPIPRGVNIVLSVEAATCFDEFTRSDKIGELRNSAWPTTFRAHRYVPAVDYLQAQRARTLLMRRFEQELGDTDVVVGPERALALLTITNLTGHPQVLLPFGSTAQGSQRSVSFVGRLYDEGVLLGVANRVQRATRYHLEHPNLA